MTNDLTALGVLRPPFDLPVHHVAYAVRDLEAAIQRAVTALGAGPFLVLDDIELETTSRGEPARFLHSAAFGQYGAVALELMQIKSCEPARIADAMRGPVPSVNHFGYVAPSLPAARDQLEALGIPAFLQARTGEIEFTMHDARSLWGHNIELHADGASIRQFWAGVRDSSVGWDGTHPIRRPDF